MTEPTPPQSELRSPYERLGGEEALRSIITDFVKRVMSDMMIGFHFRGVDEQRLIDLEFQFASRHLGGPHRYEGHPLREAHEKHPIMGGQFNRRLRILQQTLAAHAVEPEVQQLWLEHNEKLRSQITRDASDECNDQRAVSSGNSSPGKLEDPR